MKINWASEKTKELYIADLDIGDIFRTYIGYESPFTYIKIDSIVCRGATLNAVCLDDGTILSVNDDTQVIPYEGELDLKRKI